MPYVSEKQRRFMWARHPDIAEEWRKEGHGDVVHRMAKKYSEKGKGEASGDSK